MRKAFIIVMLLIAVSCPSKMDAQVKLGLKAGLNLTDLSLDEEIIDSKNRNGYFFGPTLTVDLPVLFGFDISALYDRREMELGESMTLVKQQLIAVPVNLKIRIGSNNTLEAFAFAGPQFNFSIGDKTKLIDESKEWKLKESSFSVNFGLGATLFRNLQITANYNIASGKTADVDDTTINNAFDELRKHEAKTNAWQIGMTVFF